MVDLRLISLCVFVLAVVTVSAECPETYERHGSQCYKVFAMRVTWLDGIRFCRLQNSQLLSIQSETEQHIVDGIISRVRGALSSGSFWTGGADIFTEGTFSWYYEDGQSEPLAGYTHWANREPSGASAKNENCLGMDFGGRSSLWYDRDCNELRYPICEAPSV